MKMRFIAVGAVILVGLAVSTSIVLGVQNMSDPSRLSFCHIEPEADFLESVASYDRGPLMEPAPPARLLELTLSYPFKIEQGDVLLLSVYVEGRDIEHRVYDGQPPLGPIRAYLPAQSENTAEVYWLSVAIIRAASHMTCGWSLEERFELPEPPHPTKWQIDLLDTPVATYDGGTRLTRITALD